MNVFSYECDLPDRMVTSLFHRNPEPFTLVAPLEPDRSDATVQDDLSEPTVIKV
jgi:hypothetical protein